MKKLSLIFKISIHLITYISFFYLSTSFKLRNNTKLRNQQSYNNPKFLQVQNPDQPSGGSTGGNSGEFVRRDQITEHIMIPLLNTFEVEFPFARDIRDFRKDYVNYVNGDVDRMKGIRKNWIPNNSGNSNGSGRSGGSNGSSCGK